MGECNKVGCRGATNGGSSLMAGLVDGRDWRAVASNVSQFVGWVAVAEQDTLVTEEDSHVVVEKSDFVPGITQSGYGKEGTPLQAGDDLNMSGVGIEHGHVQFSFVGGGHYATVGRLDVNGVCGWPFVDYGERPFDVGVGTGGIGS
jgi:hypothetical protein